MAAGHFLVVASAIFLALALSASPVSAAAALPDGATCYWGKEYMPASPTCKQPFQCVVTQVLPASDKRLFKGVCVNSYNYNNYCMYQSVPYAVGTTGITANFACPNCTCTKPPGATGASCECAPGPICDVDPVGKSLTSCTERQSQCSVSIFKNGINRGSCINPAAATGQCVTAGPGWGPIFYSCGMPAGAIKAGDLCQRCACNKGQFTNCKKVSGCKMCVPKKRAGDVKTQCATCCKGAVGDANVKLCLKACNRITL